MKRLNYLFTDSDDDGKNHDGVPSFSRSAVATARTREGRLKSGAAMRPESREKLSPSSSSDSSLGLQSGPSRSNMQSLFAQDSLQAQQTRTTSFRYSDEVALDQKEREVAAAIARVACNPVDVTGDKTRERRSHDGKDNFHDEDSNSAGGEALYTRKRHSANDKPRAHKGDETNSTTRPSSSPLTTASHAVVQAYRGETYVGTCIAALCVPNVRHQSRSPSSSLHKRSVVPVVAIVDATKRTVCCARLGNSLLLRLSRENPQYASLYAEDGGGSRETQSANDEGETATGATGKVDGVFWSLMFRDRREAVAFVSAAHTIVHYSPEHTGDPWRTTTTDSTAPSSRPNVISLLVPPRGGGDGTADALGSTVVRQGSRALFGYRLWLRERTGKGSQYFTIGKTVDEVPPDAPQEVLVGNGVLMDGLERAVVGMQAGEARLLFLEPGETRVRRGVGNPEVTLDDAVIAYVCCADVVDRGGRGEDHRRAAGVSTSAGTGKEHNTGLPSDLSPPRVETPRAGLVVARGSDNSSAAEVKKIADSRSATAAASPSTDPPLLPTISTNASADDTNLLLQRLLLQTLLTNQASTGVAGASNTGALGKECATEAQSSAAPAAAIDSGAFKSTAATVTRVEYATDRMQNQLMSVSDKIDRLDVRRVIEENNANIEKIVRRVVGLAPQNEAALLEDSQKDRDALLATVEKYKTQYEEANGNYQKALEGLGRYADKMHALEADVRIQKETLEARLTDTEERHRLRAVETAVKHRAERERVADEAYRKGKEDGYAVGVKQGVIDARHADVDQLDEQGGWKEKSLAHEQEILKWKTEVQEAQGRHIRERRSLQAEIDSLQLLCQRLGAQQEDIAVRVPEESAEQQCKRLKRALNAVYAQVEAQLAAHTSRGPPTGSVVDDLDHPGLAPKREISFDEKVSVKDALSALIIAIKSEAKVFTREIKTEAALRGQENEMLARVRRERREMGGTLSAAASAKVLGTLKPGEAIDFAVAEAAHGTDSTPPVPLFAEREEAAEDSAAPPAGADPVADPRSTTTLPLEEPQRPTQPFAKPLPIGVPVTGLSGRPTDSPLALAPLPLPLEQSNLGAALGDHGDGVGARPAPTVSLFSSALPPSAQPPAAKTFTDESSSVGAGDKTESAALAISHTWQPPSAPPHPTAVVSPPGPDRGDSLASTNEETPMGRLAVRLDYGSAQTTGSLAKSVEHDNAHNGDDSLASHTTTTANRQGWQHHAPMMEGRRTGDLSTAGGGGVADSPIPSFHHFPNSNRDTATTATATELWDGEQETDPFDISAPGSDVRGRDTAASLPTRGTVWLPPPGGSLPNHDTS